ncbi:MAG: hypothetical protein Q9164_007007, partial [Protoblastenia rupestris]
DDGEEVGIEARGQGSLQLGGAGGPPREVKFTREQDPMGKGYIGDKDPSIGEFDSDDESYSTSEVDLMDFVDYGWGQ